MKGNRGRELAALGVKVVRAFGVVELLALGLDSSMKFRVLHCFYLFYLFDFAKVVKFLPFARLFAKYFFIFSLWSLKSTLAASGQLTPAAPAHITNQPPGRGRHSTLRAAGSLASVGTLSELSQKSEHIENQMVVNLNGLRKYIYKRT